MFGNVQELNSDGCSRALGTVRLSQHGCTSKSNTVAHLLIIQGTSEKATPVNYQTRHI